MGLGRNLPKKDNVRTSFAQQPAPTFDWCDVARVTIDMLPDVALLEIFDFYLGEKDLNRLEEEEIEAWHTLVHVCRKWRNIVFGSPLRLDLRVYCAAKKPAKEMLEVWPPFPIVLWVYFLSSWGKVRMDNLIAALEHKDRICYLGLFDVPSSQLEKVWQNYISHSRH